MASVVGLLRTTSKGQLSYLKTLDANQLKDDLEYLSSPPLSHPHQERSCSLNGSFGLDSSFIWKDFNENSFTGGTQAGNSSKALDCKSIAQALSGLDDELEESGHLIQDGAFDTSLPVFNDSSGRKTSLSSPPKAHASSCPVSPHFGITSGAILDEEDMWSSFAELRHLQRRAQFEDHERAMAYLMRSKQEAMERRIQTLVEWKDGQVKQKQDQCRSATKSKLQRLKEDHENHHKKIHTKQQEIVRHREKLEEEEKRRQERETARLNEFRTLLGEVQTYKNTFIQTLDSCPLKDRLPDILEKYRAVLEKVSANMNQQLGSLRSVSDELLAKARENKDKSQKTVLLLKKVIADAEEMKKGEDQKKEEVKLVQKLAKEAEDEAAQDMGVKSLAYVLEELKSKHGVLRQSEQVAEAFISNKDMKKFRFDLQRAVNTPINAISPVSGQHLRDKLKRIHALLTGQLVDAGGKQVSLNNSQEGKIFCENLVAKMLVKKGEEQVTSNHESAFAIAAVVVGLWVEIPLVGDLFVAHLQTMCPYILPLYATREEGESTQDYHRSRGYKVMEDGSVEEHDKFLHRMSGLMNLYCACMVTSPPKGPNSPHPLGVHNAWMWLARTLNMEPSPDVTAAMVYDLLYVTGHFLFLEFKVQFIKMLHVLYKQFLPKLKVISVTKSTVGRLELFLESALQNNGRIEPPKGLLPPNFLLS